MKFERTWTGNWENAFHGLRHPYESYDKSDSLFGIANNDECVVYKVNKIAKDNINLLFNSRIRYGDDDAVEYAIIGQNDLNLVQRMIKAGTPNDKFLRQIFVSVDITAPLYWWKEMDTYKVGTTANSTSTMHKLATTPITIECFETDDWDMNFDDIIPDDFIPQLEILRQKYLETNDKRYWKELIRWLPESWLQTRTWTANYSVLRNIIYWRKGHKLTEWASFIDWVHTLPYAEELLFFDEKRDEQ